MFSSESFGFQNKLKFWNIAEYTTTISNTFEYSICVLKYVQENSKIFEKITERKFNKISEHSRIVKNDQKISEV